MTTAPLLTPLRCTFRVAGVPVTQGSMRLVRNKHTGGMVMLHDNANLRTWRTSVARAAYAAFGGTPTAGSVSLAIDFSFQRPAKPAHAWPVKDVDKLCRAILDALTGVIYHDDSQVTRLTATKCYGESGVTISVEAES